MYDTYRTNEQFGIGPDGQPVRSTIAATCGEPDCGHVGICFGEDGVVRCGTHAWDRRYALLAREA